MSSAINTKYRINLLTRFKFSQKNSSMSQPLFLMQATITGEYVQWKARVMGKAVLKFSVRVATGAPFVRTDGPHATQASRARSSVGMLFLFCPIQRTWTNLIRELCISETESTPLRCRQRAALVQLPTRSASSILSAPATRTRL